MRSLNRGNINLVPRSEDQDPGYEVGEVYVHEAYLFVHAAKTDFPLKGETPKMET
jgi:hypothetical protein